MIRHSNNDHQDESGATDNFETMLHGHASRPTSAALDAKIAAELRSSGAGDGSLARRDLNAESSSRRRRSGAVVSRHWAMAACLAVGCAGFFAGRVTQRNVLATPLANQQASVSASVPPSPAPADTPSVAVHVIFRSDPGNVFDGTTPSDDGLRPTTNIKTISNTGATL